MLNNIQGFQNKPSQKFVAIAFTNIYIIWGSTFLAMSYGLTGFPPFILSGFRFLIAGIILFSLKLAKGESLPSPNDWKRNAVTGILILTGGTGLVAWAEQYVTATEAAITIATGPFWFIAIDKTNWQKYFSDRKIIIGLIIGFIGLLMFLKNSILGTGSVHYSRIRLIAFAMLSLSSISWVLGSLFSRNYPATKSTVMNTAQQLLIAGIVSIIISTLRGEWTGFHFTSVQPNAWLGLLFLIIMGSIVTYLSYIWLLQVRPAAQVSTHIYINPVVAVFVGWLFTREIISVTQFVGLAIIIGGVLLTNSGKYKPSIRTKVIIRRRLRLSLEALSIITPVPYIKKG